MSLLDQLKAELEIVSCGPEEESFLKSLLRRGKFLYGEADAYTLRYARKLYLQTAKVAALVPTP
jgi:hypothetical protein